MLQDAQFSFFKTRFENRFLFVLVFLVLYLLFVPVLDNFIRLTYIMNIFFTVILLSCINAVSDGKRQFYSAIILATPMFVSMWLSNFLDNMPVALSADLFGILFYLYFAITILAFIFTEKTITREVIFAAIVVYLLIGVIFSLMYSALEILHPGSFSIGQGHPPANRMLFTYYSFITLTTLGYGDITPLRDQAYSFAILEAVIGQFYMTVLVARLVGLQISHSAKNK